MADPYHTDPNQNRFGADSDLWRILMGVGAGLASKSGQGWGPGIGAGLALGQDAVQNAQANDYKRTLLQLQMQNALSNQNYRERSLGLAEERNQIAREAAGRAKIPAGYQADPNNPGGVMPIPGGPATKLTENSAGALAMMDTAQSELSLPSRKPAKGEDPNTIPTMRDVLLQPWGAKGTAQATIGAGEIGRAQRAIRTNVEAALRMMTGAAAPEQEVQRYADMFTPQAYDTKETAEQKLRLMDEFTAKAKQLVLQGRGAPMMPPTQPAMPDRVGGGAGMIPPQAVQALQANPQLRGDFEAKYGVSADAFLR